MGLSSERLVPRRSGAGALATYRYPRGIPEICEKAWHASSFLHRSLHGTHPPVTRNGLLSGSVDLHTVFAYLPPTDLKKDIAGRKEYADFLDQLEKQKAALRKRIAMNKNWIVSWNSFMVSQSFHASNLYICSFLTMHCAFRKILKRKTSQKRSHRVLSSSTRCLWQRFRACMTMLRQVIAATFIQ
jgi:hypothetical protein